MSVTELALARAGQTGASWAGGNNIRDREGPFESSYANGVGGACAVVGGGGVPVPVPVPDGGRCRARLRRGLLHAAGQPRNETCRI